MILVVVTVFSSKGNGTLPKVTLGTQTHTLSLFSLVSRCILSKQGYNYDREVSSSDSNIHQKELQMNLLKPQEFLLVFPSSRYVSFFTACHAPETAFNNTKALSPVQPDISKWRKKRNQRGVVVKSWSYSGGGGGGSGDKPRHLNNTHPSNAVQEGKSIVPTFTREHEYFRE